ncbi:hypothetical protein Lfee_0354 [Legionella feeleii]|uniref:Uncharacterized protein n=1 Tax=Legionella feeleii TaxID=453 RepID=A0A0W0U7M6_9GAMM|nr:hypothetical protein Lfee_0354 [Legionella feeleii]SPX59267.1 Uncharacterised protein [Legionella feeleii]
MHRVSKLNKLMQLIECSTTCHDFCEIEAKRSGHDKFQTNSKFKPDPIGVASSLLDLSESFVVEREDYFFYKLKKTLPEKEVMNAVFIGFIGKRGEWLPYWKRGSHVDPGNKNFCSAC